MEILVILIILFYFSMALVSVFSKKVRKANEAIHYSNELYQDSFSYKKSPIFSPCKRYIWNGEHWIRNDGGFKRGLTIGIIIAVIIAVTIFSFSDAIKYITNI
jgi:hypothetical protein